MKEYYKARIDKLESEVNWLQSEPYKAQISNQWYESAILRENYKSFEAYILDVVSKDNELIELLKEDIEYLQSKIALLEQSNHEQITYH